MHTQAKHNGKIITFIKCSRERAPTSQHSCFHLVHQSTNIFTLTILVSVYYYEVHLTSFLKVMTEAKPRDGQKLEMFPLMLKGDEWTHHENPMAPNRPFQCRPTDCRASPLLSCLAESIHSQPYPWSKEDGNIHFLRTSGSTAHLEQKVI